MLIEGWENDIVLGILTLARTSSCRECLYKEQWKIVTLSLYGNTKLKTTLDCRIEGALGRFLIVAFMNL